MNSIPTSPLLMKPAVPVYNLSLYPTTVKSPKEKSIDPNSGPNASLWIPEARYPKPARPIVIPESTEERNSFIINYLQYLLRLGKKTIQHPAA